MSNTISITRALSKIKTLNKEISKDCQEKDFFLVAKNSAKGSDQYNELKKEVKANYDSVTDKINLIIKLKYLVSKSNLETTVKINNKEMSVTEALAMKESISLYNSLLLALKNEIYGINNQLEDNNRKIERSITEATGQAASGTSDLDLSDRIAILTEQLEATMGIHATTGTKQTPSELIEELNKFIEGFTSEIDYVLSEHNALTTIEV